ncbi:hypothetical protein EB796_009450 [Bugula neritina]|uniref:C-type lectin domain-containing protein n=1 Tax=Bugula neritina TaxID=10212 RepID=A0A7J7K2P9_BUGNE|nr:hypothetical protein EB796_009450 [Bugula neritina]
MWVDSGSGVNAWLGVVRDDESYPNWYLEDGGYHSTGEKKELKYTNWDDNEPEPIKNRKCAVFGFSSEFKWQASICNQFPYEYHIICQYDGPDGFLGKPEAYITVIVLSLILLMAGVIVFPCYCYRRRKALKTQLRKSREEDLYEDHIINTDRNTSAEYTREDNPQAHYAPVTNIPTNNNSYHNFNILSDPYIGMTSHCIKISVYRVMPCLYPQILLHRISSMVGVFHHPQI